MKLRKILALVTVFTMMLSMAATLTANAGASKPAAATDWFEFDKATGGWIVKDISRGADSGDTAPDGSPEDFGHRVQIIPYNTEEGDMPAVGDYEILLKLPELKADGEEWGFQDIAKVSVRFDIDWEKWSNPDDRSDLQIVTHNNVDDFMQHKKGGNIKEILDAAGVIEGGDGTPSTTAAETTSGDAETSDDSVPSAELQLSFSNAAETPTPLSEYPTPVYMTASPNMYKKLPPPINDEVWAEYFKVMVTNWTLAGGLPKSPITAKVTLLDHDDKVIRLVCPDCKKSECTCNCPTCGKVMSKCECNPCEQCGKFRYLCDCCTQCGKKKEDCPGHDKKVKDPEPPKKYKILEAFPDWKGAGSAKVRIDADHTKFSKLVLKVPGSADAEVDKANYEVTEGSTVITFKESYLKTLSAGTHNFVAEFLDNYIAEIPLTVNLSNSATTSPNSTGAATTTTKKANDTNPKTGVAIAVIPIFVAAGAAAATVKRKKR